MRLDTTPGIRWPMRSLYQGLKLCIAFVFISLASCDYSNVNWLGTPKTAFHLLQDDLVQRDKVYGLSNVVYDLRVVYFTDDLRQAYIHEYAKMFELSPEDKATFEKEQNTIQQEFDEFYVAHFSSKKGYQNLHEKKQDKQIWSITLQNQDSQKQRPDSIKHIKRTEKTDYFFPMMDGFSKLYRLQFKKHTHPSKTLHMQSPSRTVVFTWPKESKI